MLTLYILVAIFCVEIIHQKFNVKSMGENLTPKTNILSCHNVLSRFSWILNNE
jgi:hypothetical protein